MTHPASPTDPQQQKRAYSTPKMVVLGNVRDLTLSNGSQVLDGKASRGKAM